MNEPAFFAVHSCIIDGVGKMIFWYEKKASAAEEIKPKIHEYLWELKLWF